MRRLPFMNIVGQQEHEQFDAMEEWEKDRVRRMKNPANTLVIASMDEGADSHGVGTNHGMLAQTVFDWFDEILAAL